MARSNEALLFLVFCDRVARLCVALVSWNLPYRSGWLLIQRLARLCLSSARMKGLHDHWPAHSRALIKEDAESTLSLQALMVSCQNMKSNHE